MTNQGIKLQSKHHAQKLAGELIKKLKGSGWKAEYWQNGDWHIKFINGGLQLHVNIYDGKFTYACYLNENGSGSNAYWALEESRFLDPNKAVAAQLKLARKFVDQQNKLVSKIEENLKNEN